jgi:hypothetical protein
MAATRAPGGRVVDRRRGGDASVDRRAPRRNGFRITAVATSVDMEVALRTRRLSAPDGKHVELTGELSLLQPSASREQPLEHWRSH